MENFSTPSRVALLPRLANGATLAVLLTATWLSAEQRPATPMVSQAVAAPGATLTAAPLPAESLTQAHWSAKAQAIARNGLQTVGFQPAPQPR